MKHHTEVADYGYLYLNRFGKKRYAGGITDQGTVYKNYKAFENPALKNEICYIPEYMLLDDQNNIEPKDNLPKDFGYTHKDFLDLCNGDEKKAERCFYSCDWQDPNTWLDEENRETQDPDNIKAIAIKVRGGMAQAVYVPDDGNNYEIIIADYDSDENSPEEEDNIKAVEKKIRKLHLKQVY